MPTVRTHHVTHRLTLLNLDRLSRGPGQLRRLSLSALLRTTIGALTTRTGSTLRATSSRLGRNDQELVSASLVSRSLRDDHAVISSTVGLARATVGHLTRTIRLPRFVRVAGRGRIQTFTLRLLAGATGRQSTISRILRSTVIT